MPISLLQKRQLVSPGTYPPSIVPASAGFTSLSHALICRARQSGHIGFVITSSQTTQLFSVALMFGALWRHLHCIFLIVIMLWVQHASVITRAKTQNVEPLFQFA